MYKILVLNPGSTSTKVAYYEDSVNVCERNLDVDRAAIAGMKNIFDQMDLRKETIRNFLDEEHIRPEDLSFIVSRGGGGGNLMSGGYLIDEALVQHCYDYDTPHASSLGPVIAYEMGKQLGIPAFIYDGEGVNEFIPEACLSGFISLENLYTAIEHAFEGNKAKFIPGNKAMAKFGYDYGIEHFGQ